MDTVFTRFWQRACDLEDAQELVKHLKMANIKTEGFLDYLGGEGRERHDQLQIRLLDQGVFGVPSFLIPDEIFFGREHLDTVLWRLKGSQGPMPLLRFPWLQASAL